MSVLAKRLGVLAMRINSTPDAKWPATIWKSTRPEELPAGYRPSVTGVPSPQRTMAAASGL